MEHTHHYNLNKETIEQIGLQPSNEPINASTAPEARVFVYPGLEHVYIMECDLYGNQMPEGSCFLAFEGRKGLMGKHIAIETLIHCSIEDVRKMVHDNNAG